jgi:hypothetical protein
MQPNEWKSRPTTVERGYGHGARSGRLRALARLAEAEGFTSLALPRVATGVGGLPWDEVRPVIDDRLGDLRIPVYVYAEFHPGLQADEPAA